jgi:hypothetical protein
MRLSFRLLDRGIAVFLATLLAAPLTFAQEGSATQQPINAREQNSCPQPPDKSAPTCQPTPEQKQAPQAPVGTAAAPYEKPTGVTASRPAGAVIAPAKQRRARSILIRVSLVVGAAAAVGAVVALSHASPGRPN